MSVLFRQHFVVVVMTLMLILSLDTYGQGSGGYRWASIFIVSDTIRFDSLSTVPGSFRAGIGSVTLIDSVDYTLLPFSSTLIFSQQQFDSLKGKLIEIEYRVFAFNLEPEYSIHKPGTMDRGFTIRPSKTADMESSQGDLKREGSLTRGITLGNNQNSSLNSDLNLQLSGRLSERYEIRAAISDRNIPLQPEGSTHQIQDFDRIFIEVEGPVERFIAGDQIFAALPSHFLRFNRKVQGMGAEYRFSPTIAAYQEGKVVAGASLAKGRYHRQTLTSIEGNQGPYRLYGANGETFIVILSGSEKVFIDGELLERGSDRDYVIDYNTAQISFTDKRIITTNIRIIIEFEYSDRSYARTIMYSAVELKGDRAKINLQVFSESDLKSQNFQQPLGDVEKNLLASVGDNLSQAFLPRIDSVGFNGDEVLYKKIDTLVGGTLYTGVLVYSTHPDSAYYRAVFTYTGMGKGNYVKAKSAANGKVFQWVAPIGGIPAGDYEPVSLIVAPRSQQAVNMGFETGLGRSNTVRTELSISRLDVNTFSELDAEDDIGLASLVEFTNLSVFGGDSTKALLTSIGMEWAGMNHNPVERYLPAEFERDWNIIGPRPSGDRLQAHFGSSLSMGKHWQSKYRLEWLNYGADYHGLKNLFSTQYLNKRLKGFYQGSLLNAGAGLNESQFYRHNALAGARIANVWLVADHRFESNQFRLTDTLTSNSAGFSEAAFSAALPDTSTRTGKITFRYRNDFRAGDHELNLYSTSRNLELTLAERSSKRFRIDANIIYRDIEYSDSSNGSNDTYLISRVQSSSTLAKGNTRFRFAFETSTGSELKKEYSYLKVADGQGVYTWNDYNQDSLKQLDEFEVAVFNDQANYIRIFIPTDERVAIVNSRLTADFDIRAPVQWRQDKGLKRIMSRISADGNAKFDTRRSGVSGLVKYQPFPGSDPGPEVSAYNTSYQAHLYFRRGDPKLSLEIAASGNEQRSLMANGFEGSSAERYYLRIRSSPAVNWNAAIDVNYKIRSNESDFYLRRNFKVLGPGFEPSVSWQPSKVLRIKVFYRQDIKKEAATGFTSGSQELGSEARYSLPGRGMVQTRVSRTNVSFDGELDSPVGWEMLNSLVPGANYIWSLGLQYSLKNNIQIGFNYEGRKPPSTRAIHTGMVQARYVF